MIGYVIAQALRNARPKPEIAALLARIVVDPEDSAFACPTKPIGPVYGAHETEALRTAHGWSFAADGNGMRRGVAAPRPIDVVELLVSERLVEARVVTVCAGGGGIPVQVSPGGALDGIEAAIDKDLAAALLAQRLKAERPVILTDMDAGLSGLANRGTTAFAQDTCGRPAASSLRGRFHGAENRGRLPVRHRYRPTGGDRRPLASVCGPGR